jgi:hypothetical protein
MNNYRIAYRDEYEQIDIAIVSDCEDEEEAMDKFDEEFDGEILDIEIDY